MAVKGAFITLPINPAMPARVKLMTDNSMPKKTLKIETIKKPAIPPINNKGAKTPPTPPATPVNAVAKGLNNNKASIKIKYV